MFAFFFVLLRLLSPLSYAYAEESDCDTPIDLRVADAPLAELDNIAQGYSKSNLCGFVTFSQYLDSYRVSRLGVRGGNLVRSSGVSIGVENALRVGHPYWFPLQNSTDPLAMRVGRWGSTFCSLAASVKKMGYCTDSLLPTKNADETAKFADLTTYIYGRLLVIAGARNKNEKSVLTQEIDGVYGHIDGIYPRYIQWVIERGGVALSRAEVQATIEENPEFPYRVIEKLFFKNCDQQSNREKNFYYQTCEGEIFGGSDSNSEKFKKKVNELLSEKRALPIPMAYCSSVLVVGKSFKRKNPVGTACGLHWSLIAGRKKINGECHILVRNSWKYTHVKYSPDWVVEGGDVWVREEELSRAVMLLQWLKNVGP